MKRETRQNCHVNRDLWYLNGLPPFPGKTSQKPDTRRLSRNVAQPRITITRCVARGEAARIMHSNALCVSFVERAFRKSRRVSPSSVQNSLEGLRCTRFSIIASHCTFYEPDFYIYISDAFGGRVRYTDRPHLASSVKRHDACICHGCHLSWRIRESSPDRLCMPRLSNATRSR